MIACDLIALNEQKGIDAMKGLLFSLAILASVVSPTIGEAALPVKIVGAGTGAPFNQPSCQTFDRVFDADTIYVTTGEYYVMPGNSLIIQPGTVIEGHKATGGTLIITRGAHIFAQGTPHQPIVFTSNQAPGSRMTGDWGGIVVLGNAPTNQDDPVIEGGLVPGPCDDSSNHFGGSVADDDSGILSFIRIEFAGFRFSMNNEINGLTMGGVGTGTQIDHIQVGPLAIS